MHAHSVEVDLVALEDDTLVCVEVKTALGDSRDPRYRPGRRVDRKRIERQRRAARFLAERLSTPVRYRRFDLIEVWVDGERKRSRIELHRDLMRPFDFES